MGVCGYDAETRRRLGLNREAQCCWRRSETIVECDQRPLLRTLATPHQRRGELRGISRPKQSISSREPRRATGGEEEGEGARGRTLRPSWSTRLCRGWTNTGTKTPGAFVSSTFRVKALVHVTQTPAMLSTFATHGDVQSGVCGFAIISIPQRVSRTFTGTTSRRTRSRMSWPSRLKIDRAVRVPESRSVRRKRADTFG